MVYADFYVRINSYSPPIFTKREMLSSHVLILLAARRARRRRLQRLLLLIRARMTIQSRHYFMTDALCHPDDSPWHDLYASRDVGSFISVLSIDPDSFDYLL